KHHAQLTRVGTRTALEVAETSAPYLLEHDTLSLSAAIRDASKSKDVKFIAVLDHNDTIMAHTNPEMINRPFPDLRQKQYLDEVKGVTITSGLSRADENMILFSTDVLFSKVKIGKIQYALSGTGSNLTLRRYQRFFALALIFVTFSLALILYMKDYFAKAKALKLEKEMAGMSRIGPYILRKKIAQGGMAELYLADYVRGDGFRKTVALKKILPHLVQYPEFNKMFIREARLAALLQHPNIVQVMDFGKIDNASFLSMEYVHGKNLAQLQFQIKDNLPIDCCVFLMLQISNGLYYSHSKKDEKSGEPLNIVHRDISPQNVLISYQGEVKITDFGISKAKSEPSLTQAGVVKGKLSYMAPEQALGADVNQQADIYSFGVVSYELLIGHRLHEFSSDTEAITAMPNMEIPPLKQTRTDIPVELNDIVMKCLEKDLSSRYESARDISDDLEALRKQYNITFDATSFSIFLRENLEEAQDENT
ncbi:MAG: protein kinase, partial [Deltaproteobacteria bacterium]|nr:protein kinase [Deltaproteobacteria bacterium]